MSFSFRGRFPFAPPTGYRESPETVILFGLDVVFWKAGQVFIRHLLCMQVNSWAALGNLETKSSRSSSPYGKRKLMSEAANLQCEIATMFSLHCVFVKLNHHFFLNHIKTWISEFSWKPRRYMTLDLHSCQIAMDEAKARLPITESGHSPVHSSPQNSQLADSQRRLHFIICLALGRHLCLWLNLRNLSHELTTCWNVWCQPLCCRYSGKGEISRIQ